RGVDISAAVGIVEKVISFLFLVPSAMLSAVSVAAAQNRGAGKHHRARQAMRIGIWIVIGFGSVIFIMCQFISAPIVGLFAGNEENVIIYGEQYLKSYSVDCIFAGIHFCFSGFFSAYEKSIYSFIHNMISVVLVRVPGAYMASVLFPATLWPMGLAAPMGSLLSIVICIILYRRFVKRTLQAS
ncbi:MAG: MATE family efflux transporter, partial [Lachnospiraceae bacterium]|nr:MATE family efflux transporter [Candidatus Equihabitans merdae]